MCHNPIYEIVFLHRTFRDIYGECTVYGKLQ